MNFLLSETLCYDKLCTRATLSVFSLVALCSFSRPIILMAEWNCRWKPFWIPIGDTFQKAYLEEWQLVDEGSKRDPGEDNLQTSPNTTESAKPLRPGRLTSLSIRRSLGTPHQHQIFRGKQLENLTHQLGSSPEHHRLSRNACAILFTQSSIVPFLNV